MQFKTMDTQTFMEHCLEKERGNSDEILHNNSVKASLRKLFTKLTCHMLTNPDNEAFK